MRHPRTTLALAALLSSALAGPGHAAGGVAQWAFERTGACLPAQAPGETRSDWDGGLRCAGDRLGGLLVEEAARFLTEQGRGVFGEHFRFVHRMSWSPLGQGLAGELDRGLPARLPRRPAARRRRGRAARQRVLLPEGPDPLDRRARVPAPRPALRHRVALHAPALRGHGRAGGRPRWCRRTSSGGTSASCSARTTPGAGARPRCNTTSRPRSGARGVRATRSARWGGPSSACASP